jgi:hypothetical protein
MIGSRILPFFRGFVALEVNISNFAIDLNFILGIKIIIDINSQPELYAKFSAGSSRNQSISLNLSIEIAKEILKNI